MRNFKRGDRVVVAIEGREPLTDWPGTVVWVHGEPDDPDADVEVKHADGWVDNWLLRNLVHADALEKHADG